MKKILRNKPATITEALERHFIAPLELRDNSEDDNTITLSGYASTFQPYEMYGGPAAGGWIEQVGRSAFDKTLKEQPDLHLLINHAGMPLARTKSGTLKLMVDDHGLRVDASLDKRDPEVQALAVKMERGDMDEMSFAFRVKAQEWEATADFPDDDMALRTITELSLHKGDVSVVNFGANPTTSASVRSVEEALKIIAECGVDELAEARSDEDLVRKAQERLGVDTDLREWLDAERAFAQSWLDAERDHFADEFVVSCRFEGSDQPFRLDRLSPRNAEIVFCQNRITKDAKLFSDAEAFYRAFDPDGMRRIDVRNAEADRLWAENPDARSIRHPSEAEIDAIIAAEDEPKRGMSLRLALALAGE